MVDGLHEVVCLLFINLLFEMSLGVVVSDFVLLFVFAYDCFGVSLIGYLFLVIWFCLVFILVGLKFSFR